MNFSIWSSEGRFPNLNYIASSSHLQRETSILVGYWCKGKKKTSCIIVLAYLVFHVCLMEQVLKISKWMIAGISQNSRCQQFLQCCYKKWQSVQSKMSSVSGKPIKLIKITILGEIIWKCTTEKLMYIDAKERSTCLINSLNTVIINSCKCFFILVKLISKHHGNKA